MTNNALPISTKVLVWGAGAAALTAADELSGLGHPILLAGPDEDLRWLDLLCPISGGDTRHGQDPVGNRQDGGESLCAHAAGYAGAVRGDMVGLLADAVSRDSIMPLPAIA